MILYETSEFSLLGHLTPLPPNTNTAKSIHVALIVHSAYPIPQPCAVLALVVWTLNSVPLPSV